MLNINSLVAMLALCYTSSCYISFSFKISTKALTHILHTTARLTTIVHGLQEAPNKDKEEKLGIYNHTMYRHHWLYANIDFVVPLCCVCMKLNLSYGNSW